MRGAGRTIASVMPVSTVIIGGIGTPGFTSVSNAAEALAAAELDRADLGDRAARRRPARRLEVDHDERDLARAGCRGRRRLAWRGRSEAAGEARSLGDAERESIEHTFGRARTPDSLGRR